MSSTATRLDVNMDHWAPVTRLYAVDGGYLAVTVLNFFTATGTHIHFCDEQGIPIGDTMQALVEYPAGTTHNEALMRMGYNVVDDIGDEPAAVVEEQVAVQEQSVIDMLPEPIAAMVANALAEGS